MHDAQLISSAASERYLPYNDTLAGCQYSNHIGLSIITNSRLSAQWVLGDSQLTFHASRAWCYSTGWTIHALPECCAKAQLPTPKEIRQIVRKPHIFPLPQVPRNAKRKTIGTFNIENIGRIHAAVGWNLVNFRSGKGFGVCLGPVVGSGWVQIQQIF
eukprot:401508-Amphidinium_carterae.1